MGARDARPLLIFPYNGNGREALDCLGDAYHCVGFVDDTPEKQGDGRHGHRVFDRRGTGGAPGCRGARGARAVRPRTDRGGTSSTASECDPDRFARVVHPAARISSTAVVGRNVLVMAGVVITSDAVVGDHVCVLPNTVIHHDVGDRRLDAGRVERDHRRQHRRGRELLHRQRHEHHERAAPSATRCSSAWAAPSSATCRPVRASRAIRHDNSESGEPH